MNNHITAIFQGWLSTATFLFAFLIIPSLTCAIEVSDADLLRMQTRFQEKGSVTYPENNLFSAEKLVLGKMLFFDPRFSTNQQTACATCHNPSLGWQNGLSYTRKIGKSPFPRRTQSLLNMGLDSRYFSDGRAASIEEQVLISIESTAELNIPMERLLAKLAKIPAYLTLFQNAFPYDETAISAENVIQSLATYERSIVSGNAPFDAWIAGDNTALSAQAQHGFILFNRKAGCVACHSGWEFSDHSFHDIGLPDMDIGRANYLPFLAMQFAFKTPSLRNVAKRAPYMHHGGFQTLRSILDHYNESFVRRSSISMHIHPLHLTDDEMDDIVEFLKSLNGSDTQTTLPILPQ